LLYLHGFASGPQSSKARAFAAHCDQRGVPLKRLNLRVPSMEHLRLSAMIAHVQAHIGTERDRAVLIGSSLGGLTACRVAERDARVCALVLMAPAFRMFERMRARLGPEKWREWKETGFLEFDDYANGGQARVGFGFVEDGDAVEAEGDGWPDVRVPTLLFHGVRDDVVDVGLSRAWARGKRHVRLVELDDGHELTASIDRILMETMVFLAPQGIF
jgi:hypothetical protein